MTGRLSAAAATAVALLLLAGCGDGAAEATDTREFGSCIEDAGLSLDGSGDWEQPEWTALFSQPEALGCAVSDLGEEDRRTALTEAFPSYWEDDAPEGSYETRIESLVAYTAATTATEGEDSALLGGRDLVVSLDWQEAPDADGAVIHLVVATLEEQGDLPGYEAYLQENAFEDETEGRSSYGVELRTSEGSLNDRFRELHDGVIDSFDASALVP